jgi:hypothetical protein
MARDTMFGRSLLQGHCDMARGTMFGRAQIQLKYDNMFLLFLAKPPQVTAAIPLVSWRTVDGSLPPLPYSEVIHC